METIPHKRGDTFLLTCTTDVPLTGYSIASQVRDKSFKLIAQLTVNITQTSPTGIYTLSYPAGSSSWPVGLLECDVQYTDNTGFIVSTETFEIDVNLDAPLVVEPGTYVHVILKMPVGSATASQVIRGLCGINSYFE
jgi:hypothetical protein